MTTSAYVVQRIDRDDGGINYEIWDHRPASYRWLCTIAEDHGRRRGQAKKDAELIAGALNAASPTLSVPGE